MYFNDFHWSCCAAQPSFGDGSSPAFRPEADGNSSPRKLEMMNRTIQTLLAGMWLSWCAQPAMAADTAAEAISSFRLKHGEVRVTSDAVLNRIAQEQAHAMATRDKLDHEVAGAFSSRI